MDEVRTFNVAPDDDGIRVDRWFKRHLPQIGFGTVSRWARTGQLRVDGKRVKPEDRLTVGQTVRVPPGGDAPAKGGQRKRAPLTEEQEAEAEAMLLERTASALVLNKPPGLATQGGTKTTKHVDGLLEAYANDDEPRPRLVHRLDKDTSGVLLVARTPGSAAYFSKNFSSRAAKKIYWALVVGVPEVHVGTIEAPIGKQAGTGGEKMEVDVENGQTARTAYRVVDRAGNSAAWVELQPFTGRTHQLRVHMAAIGHPIVGDGKYGGQDAFLTGTISRKMHLHARRLIIDAPKGEVIDVTAPLPEHFSASMTQLGFDEGDSDAGPVSSPPPERTKAQQKQVAKAHSKQYRKERRGERSGRRTGKADARAELLASPKGGAKTGPKAGPKTGGKAGPKSGPKTGAKTGSRGSARPGARPDTRPDAKPRRPGGKPTTGPRR